MIRTLMVLCALSAAAITGAPAAQHSADPDAQDHEALRALLVSLRESFNAGDRQVFADYLYPKFAATMVDQELLTSREDLERYLDKWFGGAEPQIRRLTMDPVADTLTQIFEGRFGIVYGTNRETYEFTNGQTHVLNSRWTATVIKDAGQWRLLAIHSGVNFLDNPVVTIARRASLYFGGGGLVVGALLGLVVGTLHGRKRAPAPA